MFDLQVNGSTEEADAQDGGTTGYVNVAVGSNPTVGEAHGTNTALSDYDSSIACSGDSDASSSDTGPLAVGDLAAGEVVDCTITNKRKAQLAVVKKLDPATDDGTFDLRIDGATKKQDASNNDGTGFHNVANGAHSVSELNGTNSPNTLSDYESSVTCDNGDTNTPAGGTSLTTSALGYGDKVTCEITNKRKPRVKVTKDLYPAIRQRPVRPRGQRGEQEGRRDGWRLDRLRERCRGLEPDGRRGRGHRYDPGRLRVVDRVHR